MTQADKQSGQQPVARKGGLARLASWSGRQWCLLGALGCAFLLGVAFVLQFAFDLAPCSLCIFQRVAVAVAGVFFLLAASSISFTLLCRGASPRSSNRVLE